MLVQMPSEKHAAKTKPGSRPSDHARSGSKLAGSAGAGVDDYMKCIYGLMGYKFVHVVMFGEVRPQSAPKFSVLHHRVLL